MTTGDPEKKALKRKELSVGQLKAIASDLARALPLPAESADAWQDFARLPQSERRRVVDLLSENARDISIEGLIRLSRMTLTGGVANKHEGALKAVVALCSRCFGVDARQHEVLRNVLIDLIDPTPLAPLYSIPHLRDLDPQDVATLPGIADAFGSLFTDPVPRLPLGNHVQQWARLLGAIMVTAAVSASVKSEVGAAILGTIRGLPLKSRPLELQLAERVLEDLTDRTDPAPGLVEVPGQNADTLYDRAANPRAERGEVLEAPSISQALEMLQRGISRLEEEQRERRAALAATIESLQANLGAEKLAYRDLEERHGRLGSDLQRVRTEAVNLKEELELVAKDRDTAIEERETLRRELTLLGGIGTTAIDAARAEVRKSFARLSLLPLKSVRAFAERLRADSTVENPDLLIVPLRTVIQVLHSQGFATESEIEKI